MENSTQTCPKKFLLQKIVDILDSYRRLNLPALVIKAVLDNRGYSSTQGHNDGHAIDVLCGPGAGRGRDIERNCSRIIRKCIQKGSNDTNFPAEKSGCGSFNANIAVSVHCSFFPPQELDLSDKSAGEILEAVQNHFVPWKQNFEFLIRRVRIVSEQKMGERVR